jgi:lysozyme family protein
MSAFDLAADYVLQNEGVLSDHPADKGGLTKYGIILPVLREMGAEFGDKDGDGDIDGADIRALTVADAKAILKQRWWDKYGYGLLSAPGIAAKVMDAAFNMGPRQGHIILQRAVNAVHPGAVTEDGILGPLTIKAANECWPAALRAALRSEMAAVYRMILQKDPTQEAFRKGWLARAYR